MSFVLRTTTTSAPQNSVVVYVSHNLHRGVTDKIVVVVKLVVVAGNNTQRKRRKQRSPLRRTFSLLLFYSFLFLMLLFRVRFSSLFMPRWWDVRFCEKKYSFLAVAKFFFADYFFLSASSFHFSSWEERGNFFLLATTGKWFFVHNPKIAQKLRARTTPTEKNWLLLRSITE